MIDISNRIYGRLKVIKPASKKYYWVCICDCNKKCTIYYHNLLRGTTKSCGCLQKESVSKSNSTHKKSKTSVYIIWTNIITRCFNKNSKYYDYYGGRGIKCEWDSFEEFYRDMGERPSKNHSIDRINNNGNYSKDNCRWATKTEQSNNRRNNHMLKFKNTTLTMSNWAKEVGLSRSTIKSRLKRGWSIEKTLTTKKLINQYC